MKTVFLVGRRGPLQVAFTIKELREMLNLEGCASVFEREHFEGIPELIPSKKWDDKSSNHLQCLLNQ